MGPTGATLRVLQLHVSRRCNLSCSHCYSSSGPNHSDELPPTVWHEVIEDAAGEGYNVVGFSGGEPLMFRPLRSLLMQARSLGMLTTVTTNGMLLDEQRIKTLKDAAGLVAISLDGTPESHNRMRGHSRAFSIMEQRLPALRDAGIPFGFIFTLTQFNLDELVWAADFALQQAASLLQVHPLEPVGRALDGLGHAVPDPTELSYAVLAVARLKELVGDRLVLQLDVAGRDSMADFPERVFADGERPDTERPLGELLSPLIVEADGTVVPVEYAFGRRWALGNARDNRLQVLASHWKRNRLADFRVLCGQVQRDATSPEQPAVINWYGRLAEASTGKLEATAAAV
jgi:MoaA/NifB/PqqE/SkfB family radical SAM enzyme